MTEPTRYVDDIAELAAAHEFRVGAAESLTGGAVSSALAMGSGAASWYHGGVVAYSRTVKQEVLGVTADKLVTQECAEQMVRGVVDVLKVDAAVSTTGCGGPEPEEGQPAGTVHVGVLVRGTLRTHRLAIEGGPGEVVEGTTEKVLGLLLEAMQDAVAQGAVA